MRVLHNLNREWQNNKFFRIVVFYSVIVLVISFFAIIYLMTNYKSKEERQKEQDESIFNWSGYIEQPRNGINITNATLLIDRGISAKTKDDVKSIVLAYYSEQNRDTQEKITDIEFSEIKHFINKAGSGANTYTGKLILNKDRSKTNSFRLSIFGIDDLPKVEIGPDEKNLKTIFDPEK